MTKVNVENKNKGVYIPSIEAEIMYDMSVRGLENVMQYDYKGMIPYSLELIKLRSFKKLFAEKEIIKNGRVKFQSDAIINVKFKNKIKKGKEITSNVRGYDNLISRLESQLKNLNNKIPQVEEEIRVSSNKRHKDKLEKRVNYLKNKAKLVQGHIERIKADKDNEIYQEVKASQLRKQLYVNGITFKGRRYVFYKRTASKSRTSQTLFILEDLFQSMKDWSHMGLDLTGKLDVAAVLSYESLVSSSIVGTVNINPDNIFIIDDQFSTFNCPAIEVGDDLKAKYNDKATLENNIWDGQALIDISLMESVGLGDKGSAQLRQAFFKCCSFSTRIQLFLQDKHKELTNPNHENYDPKIPLNYKEWKLKDVFGRMVPTEQILLISTPSACKFLKFAKKVDDKAEQVKENKKVFDKWCKHIKKDKHLKNTFGICSYEKPSKYGDYSFTSYQMINTLDVDDKDDIENLTEFEVKYIESLQGLEDEQGNINDTPFIEYLEKKKELTNAYQMLIDMYNINPNIVHTQMFRDYRSKQISNYRTKVKGGKIRIESQYATVVSNPYEMLLSVINKMEKDNKGQLIPQTLSDNQIYTKLYDFDEEYTLVRNPHNSMNNYFKAINTDNELLNTYFNFTKNIVVINSIKCPILSVMNGMDTDGDKILIVKDTQFNKIINKTLSNRNYPVIQNTIKSKGEPVELTNEVIAQVDDKTADSQRYIGSITNQAQYQVSVLWDIQNTEKDTLSRQDKMDQILKNLAVDVVLSNVAIDYSKKNVEVDIDEALSNIRKSDATKIEVEIVDKKGKVKTKLKARKKPNFWKYVSTSDVQMDKFNCPMDKLIDRINNIENSPYRKDLPFGNLLISMTRDEMKKGGVDAKQIGDIIGLVKKFDKEIKKINTESDGDTKCQERQALIEDAYNELDERMSKKNIRKATMYKILEIVAEQYDEKAKQKKKKNNTNDVTGIIIHLLNTLYRTHRSTFLNLLKK